MVSKAFTAIVLAFNTIMGFLIFLSGAQIINMLASNSRYPLIVSNFNFWSVTTVPYEAPGSTPIPTSILPSTYFPTYGFIFMLIVNILVGLILLRSKKEEGTKISS